MPKKLKLEELNRPSVADFQMQQKIPLVLILDNIRSMNNVGSAFRTADAFNVEKIYLAGITACPPNREITKTALGADETVVWEHNSDILAIIKKLKEEGYIICAIEQVDQSVLLQKFVPEANAKYAYVFGNEVFGVNEEVVDLADYCIEIPQFGTKHSLNISVTVGITCWDFIVKAQLGVKK
ncbi:MAG: RNA methyltransferase [Bacteroidota bacterium]